MHTALQVICPEPSKDAEKTKKKAARKWSAPVSPAS
jgi:hypothetical protein